MTIEIRQLIIRAVVDQTPSTRASHDAPQPASLSPAVSEAGPDAAAEQQATVAACVREVMRRLKRARER